MNSCGLRGRVIALVVLFILYLFFDWSPASQSSFKALDHAVEEELVEWRLLNTSSYGDFDPAADKWLNLTGFGQSEAWFWEILPEVQAKARESIIAAVGKDVGEGIIQAKHPLAQNLQFYHNTSGHVIGPWKQLNIQGGRDKSVIDLTIPLEKDLAPYHRNVTGQKGSIEISFRETGESTAWQDLNARGLRARIQINEDDGSSSWLSSLQGIHLLETGSIILTTHSQKLPGLFGLPHLALSERHFLTYQHRLNKTLRDTINAQSTHDLRDATPWSSYSDIEGRGCELIVYLQQFPLQHTADVTTIEHDLRHPSGRQLKVENMHMTMILFSPDCGYVLESFHDPYLGPTAAGHLVGLKTEIYHATARKHFLLLSGILLLQMMSSMRQVSEASTPSTKSRISIHTMIMLVVADFIVTLSSVSLVAMSDSLLLASASIAFIATMSASINLKFLSSIWKVQHDDAIRERRQQAETPVVPVQVPVITMAGADSLPFPVTAGPGSQFLGIDGQNLGNTEATVQDSESTLYYLIGFGTVSLWLISIWMTTWSTATVETYFFILAMIYVSCWTPQILRNAIRNCRRALRWDFVTSQSILRLCPLLYFYAYDGNLANLKPSLTKSIVLIGLMWFQICILTIQYVFGPRLLAPRSWLPPVYDYHPILREDDECATILGHFDAHSPTLPVFDSVHAIEGTQAKNRRFDCAICMQTVEVPVISNSSPKDNGDAEGRGKAQSAFLWKSSYMITPCRHVFHSKCLESAMRYRLQCPICREGLPPL